MRWEIKGWGQALLAVHSCRTRGNGLRLEHKEFCTNRWMNGKSDGILEQVAWKCCGDSFYRSCCLLAFFFLFKTRLDVYLYNLLYGSCFGGAVRIDDLLRSLPIQDSLVLWVGSFCARISSNSSAVLLLENSEQWDLIHEDEGLNSALCS